MGLLFLILKVVGVLLAAVLLLVAAVLLVPVRYRICIRAWDDIAVSGAVSWLFRLFCLNIQYREGGARFQLRILGIPLTLGKEKANKKEKKKRNARKMRKKRADTEESPYEPEAASHKENVQDQKKPFEGEAPEGFTGQDSSDDRGQPEESGTALDNTISKESAENKFNKDAKRIPRKQKKRKKKQARKRVSDTKDGILSGKEKLENIKNMILDETNKNAFLHAFRELRVLMRHYLPGKASGELVFGLGEPDRTGKVLGLVSCFPAWARYQISLTPDFEAESIYAKGEVDMKGHIRCWHFLWSAFRLFKDKNVKKLIRKFRT